ncbi:hypothetical protein, partial [Mucilaginibacter sp.]|uniref:hypothetical protein n=1 Tax=Mucilaginibacter sp. TaxID=1882438 RepID=UPI002ED6827D
MKLHKNWNGPISEILYNRYRFHESSTILNEAILQLKDFTTKEKLIVPYSENEKNANYNIFNFQEEDKMPWYENVFELLTFSSIQYKIDLVKDYYTDEKCFISKYGINNEPIAILCSIEYPKISSIRRFVNFAKSQEKKICKFIIAVKNLDADSYTINSHGEE